MSHIDMIFVSLFFLTQATYLLSMVTDVYFYSRPVNKVDMNEIHTIRAQEYPHIVLFYPVLRELEETMRTTFHALARLDYPHDRYSIIAIPNADDIDTVASLHRLQEEFSFLEVLTVPSTSDARWQHIWDAWKNNPHAYWFNRGARAGVRDLPPKKTRQLIYAFYTTYREWAGAGDFLVNYIDADSAPPPDHFKAAAVGMRHYDVLQATNIAGNLLHSLPASWFAFDHLVWDANKYGHLTADGKHPYWVLGKGLFFKASDLYELGGFHPWITIEDPEVGLRLWKNGRTLGLIDTPLIEEVPETLSNGIRQRKRWVAGFFQSLNVPLKELRFTRMERFKAWLNFLPCISLSVNAVGIPIGIWAIARWTLGTSPLPTWSLILAALNLFCFTVMMLKLYTVTWKRTRVVLPGRLARLWYLIRVNPVSLLIFWLVWTIPLWLGWRMYRKDTGLIWERTRKINANNDIVREGFIYTKPS